MQTSIRTTIIAILLLCRYVIGFVPVSSLSVQLSCEQSHSRLNAIDFRGSAGKSSTSDVQLLISSQSSEYEASAGIEESRNALEHSLFAASMQTEAELVTDTTESSGWSYGRFAKEYPNANNLAIASVKTACADLVAQVAVAHTPISEIDWTRTFLFFTFGFSYMGAFQYWYQVNIFKKFFDVDKFTSQSWSEKLQDKDGLISLAAQTFVDMTVSTIVYLPTFYMFQAAVFSGSTDPSVWLSQAFDNLNNNFSKDEVDLIKIWGPADLVCFSVPLYLRLPSRHAVSFLYITYFSFLRCS